MHSRCVIFCGKDDSLQQIDNMSSVQINFFLIFTENTLKSNHEDLLITAKSKVYCFSLGLNF